MTDEPVSEDELAQVNGRIVQFPVAMNAVVPVYNLPEVSKLRFSGRTLASILLGEITKWNHPKIADDNPGIDLPPMDIKVRHNFPHGSAETHVLAEYLSEVSPAFKVAIASPSNASWPLPSYRYKGSQGTAGFVSATPGSFGYLPLAIARAESHWGPLKYAAVKNSEGDFVTASPESVTAAGAAEVPFTETQAPDFRASITNAPGKTSYPIASFMWLVVHEGSGEDKESQVMTDFLKWVLTDGQKLALKLGYPPLPNSLVKMELPRLVIAIPNTDVR